MEFFHTLSLPFIFATRKFAEVMVFIKKCAFQTSTNSSPKCADCMLVCFNVVKDQIF